MTKPVESRSFSAICIEKKKNMTGPPFLLPWILFPKANQWDCCITSIWVGVRTTSYKNMQLNVMRQLWRVCNFSLLFPLGWNKSLKPFHDGGSEHALLPRAGSLHAPYAGLSLGFRDGWPTRTAGTARPRELCTQDDRERGCKCRSLPVNTL